MFISQRYRSFLIWYLMITSQSQTNEVLISQAFIQLSDLGLEFSPIDEDAVFLSENNADSIATCAQLCLSMTLCRTLNFDSQSKRCRLYEGDIESTGSIIASSSSESLVGSMEMLAENFINQGRPCSFCEDNRLLTCVNSTCYCQPHTYFNGTVCQSQKLSGVECASKIECRNDLNLTCQPNLQCGLATTPVVHNASCVNQTWSSSSNLLARWSFDGSLSDQMNNYNLTPTHNLSFTTAGYVNQAVVFTPDANQMLVGPYMHLSNTSFTIDTWIYILEYTNRPAQAIFGLCPTLATDQCLQIMIVNDNPGHHLTFRFYNDDVTGVTSLALNTWYHTVFMYDIKTATQSIYFNGILEITGSSSSLVFSSPDNITIGNIDRIRHNYPSNFFLGYMDQMSVSTRTKSPYEILEIASLVAYFTFDTGMLLIDSGPNSLQATTQATSTASSGRLSQAIHFDGSLSSYFQVSAFTALGVSNQTFSISLWLRPSALSGIIVHVSTNVTGGGAWYLPFLAFTTNGSIVAQISNSNGIISISDATKSVSKSVWSHVVQTWSSTNGLRLFINNILVASNLTVATTYIGSGVSNYITLGNALSAATTCTNAGQVGACTPYVGIMDEFQVYSRELSADDIYALYTK